MTICMVDIGTSANVNVASGKWWEEARYARKLVGYQLTGSSAAMDCKAKIYFGEREVVQAYNTHTEDCGEPGTNFKYCDNQFVCPKNTPVQVVPTTASQSGVAYMVMVFRKVKS